VQILTEPRNALVKQYQRIFEYENVKLKFTSDALESIARRAIGRKVGARGLRMILEELMLEIMFHLPSKDNISECVITKEAVENRSTPLTLIEKAG